VAVTSSVLDTIDVSKYTVDELHTLASMYTDSGTNVGQENVEYILSGLKSEVDLVLYKDPAALGYVSPRERDVIIKSGVATPGELVFNDIRSAVEIVKLNLTLEGGASIAGDLRLPTVNDGALIGSNFDTLTINSKGTAVNKITGNVTAIAATPANPNISSGGVAEIENNLLKVVINADRDLEIGTYAASDGEHTSGGDIVFTSIGSTAASASLTINGTANVKMHGVDITDNDTTESIGTLTITNNSAGTLTMTGGTAAIAATNAESDLQRLGQHRFGEQRQYCRRFCF